jgi:hypothetical protein
MQNGALDRKIWALEALKGKMIFGGIWGFSRDFGGFLESSEWFRTYL